MRKKLHTALSDVKGPEYVDPYMEIVDAEYQSMYGVPTDDEEYDEMKDVRRDGDDDDGGDDDDDEALW